MPLKITFEERKEINDKFEDNYKDCYVFGWEKTFPIAINMLEVVEQEYVISELKGDAVKYQETWLMTMKDAKAK